MHPSLKLAMDRADELLTKMTSGEDSPVAERARLEKLSKEELIEELLTLKVKKMKDIKVEDMVYAIMCDPDCSVLSHAMIASILVKYRPGKTNEGNIRWYSSKAYEKGIETVPRITQKEFNKLILASVAA